jgi:hypothetical protein
MTKIAGSGSGSISQRHGSADPDPDPHQNVLDPEHTMVRITNLKRTTEKFPSLVLRTILYGTWGCLFKNGSLLCLLSILEQLIHRGVHQFLSCPQEKHFFKKSKGIRPQSSTCTLHTAPEPEPPTNRGQPHNWLSNASPKLQYLPVKCWIPVSQFYFQAVSWICSHPVSKLKLFLLNLFTPSKLKLFSKR